MRKPLFKGVLISMFLIVAVLSTGQIARAAEAAPYGALMAVDVCACCPAKCGGGTFIGCYHVVGMPPNAVTCVYSNSGTGPGCVSCLLSADTDLDTRTAALNAIFEEASPAVAPVTDAATP